MSLYRFSGIDILRASKCQKNVVAFSCVWENVKKMSAHFPAFLKMSKNVRGQPRQWRILTPLRVIYANGRLSTGVLACQIGQREIIHWRHRWSDQPVEDHALLHMRIRSASGTLSFGALQCQIHQWKIIQWRPSESAPPVEDYSLTPLKVRSAIGGLPSGALEIQIRQ
jgi:hypothetical protein